MANIPLQSCCFQQYALASYIVPRIVAPCNRCYFYTQK
nr:MAG TPA: hypothetical protein [Caudoviricetes sp.]